MKKSLFFVVSLTVLFLAISASAETKRYCRIGGDPVNKNRELAGGEKIFTLTEDVLVDISGKSGRVYRCYLREGEMVVLDEETGKIKWVKSCGNDIKNDISIELPKIKPQIIPAPAPIPPSVKTCEAKFIQVEPSVSPDKLIFVGSVNGADRVSFEYDTGASFTNPVATQGTSVPEQAIIDVESFSLAPGNNYYVRVKGVTTDGEICYSSPFGFKFMSRAVAQAQIQEDSWIGTGLHCAGTGMIPYGIYAKNPWIWGAGIAANIIGYLADRNISNRDIGAAIFCGVAGGFLGEGAYNKGGHIANKIKPGPHPEMPVIPIIEHPTIPSI